MVKLFVASNNWLCLAQNPFAMKTPSARVFGAARFCDRDAAFACRCFIELSVTWRVSGFQAVVDARCWFLREERSIFGVTAQGGRCHHIFTDRPRGAMVRCPDSAPANPRRIRIARERPAPPWTSRASTLGNPLEGGRDYGMNAIGLIPE
jgi:hypothetical protein